MGTGSSSSRSMTISTIASDIGAVCSSSSSISMSPSARLERDNDDFSDSESSELDSDSETSALGSSCPKCFIRASPETRSRFGFCFCCGVAGEASLTGVVDNAVGFPAGARGVGVNAEDGPAGVTGCGLGRQGFSFATGALKLKGRVDMPAGVVWPSFHESGTNGKGVETPSAATGVVVASAVAGVGFVFFFFFLTGGSCSAASAAASSSPGSTKWSGGKSAAEARTLGAGAGAGLAVSFFLRVDGALRAGASFDVDIAWFCY